MLALIPSVPMLAELRRGLSFEEYAAIPAINVSALLYMATSARHFRYYLTHGREDTDATKLGRATHSSLLEPDRFAREFVVWTGARRQGKVWEDFDARNIDKTILKQDDYALALAMRDAIQEHPVARAYLDDPAAHRELTLTWTDKTGLPCKARLDLLAQDIVDFKTSLHAEPFQFGRQAANLRYHVRAAFYVDGLLAVTGEEKRHSFISVEKKPPFDVVPYNVPDELIALGRAVCRPLLERVAECFERDEWPGVAPVEPINLVLPSWAMGADTPDSLMIGGEEHAL